MVEMLEDVAAAVEGCFADDLLLLDFVPDHDALPVLAAEGGEGEEELEWLSNKDAFPSLETSLEFLTKEAANPVSVLVAAAAPSVKVPVRPRSKGRRRRRREVSGIPPPSAAVAAAATSGERRRCRHCQAAETPQWRAGPEGPKTLCNACGVRYKSGRLVPEYRPASSPTFSAAIHSNSHRRILEMRRRNTSATPGGRRPGRPAAFSAV
ncbi:GATA transcription factor 1 [Typha angustifolia]|uniref:GATA transcription factor 1 n=1 Tax=Typha angustifolia TaxID=59011 RepID=UPI003C30138A